MPQHPPANNGVQLPATAVKDGGSKNNDQGSVAKAPKNVRELPSGNTREDR